MKSSNPMTYSNKASIPNILGDSSDWLKRIFGRKNILKYNVQLFFFQLVATKLITFEWINNGKEVNCVLSRDTTGKLLYTSPCNWSGFKFRSSGQRGAEVSHRSLLN